MATSNRSQKINQMFKVLGKTYEPVGLVDRPVLEHLLYACCLENSLPDAADETFAKLQELYFDWNEVRVTSVRELEEVMSALDDPTEAATRLTHCLQSVFESQYNFDLEGLKKKNQGKAVEELKRMRGTTPFSVQYVVQHALGGHAIPISQGVLDVLVVLGVISPQEAKAGKAPGLERAVPKKDGPSMASLLHQLGVSYRRSPFSPKVREIILKIAPDAKERLPKRTRSKPAAKASETRSGSESKAKAEKKTTGKKKAASGQRKKTTKSTTAKSSSKKTPAAKKKATTKKSSTGRRQAKTAKSSSKTATKTLARRKPR